MFTPLTLLLILILPLTPSCPQTSGNAKDVCVILLFSSWVLDTRAKFVLACVGVVLLGIGIEAMLCFRLVSDHYFDIVKYIRRRP